MDSIFFIYFIALAFDDYFKELFTWSRFAGCNEAWDRFDVLKIGKSCGTCLSKIVS